jgi:hypothetical protein
VLLVGIGGYVSYANNYFGLFESNKDVEKGLMQASEIKESPAPAVAATPPATNDKTPTEQVAAAEASSEGESTDPPVATSQLPAGEEAAVERAATIDTTVDNQEVEVMGGDN